MTHRGPFQPLPFCDSVILCQSRWILAIVSHIMDPMLYKYMPWASFCNIMVVYLWAASHIVSRWRKCLWAAWCLIYPSDVQSSIAEPAIFLLYCWISKNTQRPQSSGSAPAVLPHQGHEDSRCGIYSDVQHSNLNCPSFAVVLKTTWQLHDA